MRNVIFARIGSLFVMLIFCIVIISVFSGKYSELENMIVRIKLSADTLTPTFNFRGVVNEIYVGSVKTDLS